MPVRRHRLQIPDLDEGSVGSTFHRTFRKRCYAWVETRRPLVSAKAWSRRVSLSRAGIRAARCCAAPGRAFTGISLCEYVRFPPVVDMEANYAGNAAGYNKTTDCNAVNAANTTANMANADGNAANATNSTATNNAYWNSGKALANRSSQAAGAASWCSAIASIA